MSRERISDEPGTLLKSCQQRIGYKFKNESLLNSALTHASGATDRLSSNERLEFLGDAILGFVVCEVLFARFPDLLEGDLTQIKSSAVSRATCAKLGAKLRLDDFLVLGKGMGTQQALPTSLVANAMESLIAAIYLDSGLDEVRRFILEHFSNEIEAIVAGKSAMNFKSALQQLSQRQFGVAPTYPVLDEQGPDHDKSFQICAQIGKRRFTPSWGSNKKEGEQRAASNALAELDGEVPPFQSEY